jgi:hypothetical protein
MTERACFVLASSTGATIKSEMAQGAVCQVAPREGNRLAAEVATAHGRGIEP